MTPAKFIRRSMILSRQFQKIEKEYADKMRKLNDEYAAIYCKYKIGDVIELPEGAKEGYTHFKIDQVVPQIAPGKTSDESKQSFEITFTFAGHYLGEGKEPLKGAIKPQQSDEHQENKKAIEN